MKIITKIEKYEKIQLRNEIEFWVQRHETNGRIDFKLFISYLPYELFMDNFSSLEKAKNYAESLKNESFNLITVKALEVSKKR